ncbi:hypothetical protein L227DRAFT_342849 [Lentinus tigrinus ALCF2SS1-6]|uniref:Homeobox domain-containing protein n=2 Tax=Lentinus tigrinus TaxID=5365 RepID=A0A5C2RVM5_9APHY|nr:hypothetical protein L227DRAFT_342849 [Lentinus tigrinus ALCF2SS1-6]
MSFPFPDDGNSIHYITPTASQISSHSALGNWDGSRPPPPPNRNHAPAAPAYVTPHVPPPIHNNPPFPPAPSHAGGAQVHGPHMAVPGGHAPAAAVYGGTSNFGAVSSHAAHGQYTGAFPHGPAGVHGPMLSVPGQCAPTTLQAEWRGSSSVASGFQQVAHRGYAPEPLPPTISSIHEESGQAQRPACTHCYLSSRNCDRSMPSCGRCQADGLASTCVYQSVTDTRAVTYKVVMDVLDEYYQTQSKLPTYEERLMLARRTGCRTEDIKNWFGGKRYRDPNYVPSDVSSRSLTGKKPNKKVNGVQTAFLEDYLRRNDNPNGPQRDWIAEQLGMALDTERIQNWFKGRRC